MSTPSFNPNTKKGVVFTMLKRGTTLQSIIKKLQVSEAAAQSLINDVKRSPYVKGVEREVTDKGNKYKLVG